MTIDRAIEIFDPDNPETYKDAAEIEEAMRMAVIALTRIKDEASMPCAYCGWGISRHWKWCPHCGRGVKQ